MFRRTRTYFRREPTRREGACRRLLLFFDIHNKKCTKTCVCVVFVVSLQSQISGVKMEGFYQTDWLLLVTKLVLATALGYLIGLERELHGKVVGTRTISLMAIGSALYVLMSPTILDGDNSRIIAQVVSGIGFLGAGIIFKNGDTVHGLTTAATVWCAAAIGCLCGYGMFAEAIAGTAAIMIVNIFFKHLRSEKKE